MTATSGFGLTGVSFAYGETPALADLDISLQPGKFYGIVGPNGCGKTTFLDLLTGTKSPDRGSVTFMDRPVADYLRRDLARLVALVPQDFAIDFAFTVQEVVLMGRHSHIGRFASPGAEDWQQVDAAMAAIGISHFKDRFVNELSGGEKQRVVVARALAQQTPCLLFDEATSSLDVQYTMQIFNVAKKLVQEEGRTVIAVIHNLNLAAAYCDELIFMKKGKVAASGPTNTVLESAMIKKVFGVESRVAFDAFSNTQQISFRYWS
ncbi:MAG: ABC transporter ATP-binding protein [Deltaproteobacteria bacterium]|uniref:ABC transporter ATP-binding protein n=1 Tax=Hydrosulfovibrio ferrireducens TaxID=2934181 RepID=UPI000CA7DCA8|nr:MAG: ABC transporter ATP-binding protein [Deltaproteobacteria bacterium HGW-Deltaproteobacteria-16]TDB30868.1 MAG: ABC transporter ATP-binding protein [Deltaproteobacteria bacterium]